MRGLRNRGVGAALMAAIPAEARSRALVHVTVHSGRRAVDFYLRNGFSQPPPAPALETVALTVQGRGSVSDLAAAIADLEGVLAVAGDDGNSPSP